MAHRLQWMLAVLAANAGGLTAAGPCFSNYSSLASRMVYRQQSCYEFNDDRVIWTIAQRSCQSRLGRLAFIADAGTQQFLESAAASVWPNQNSVWIGLHKMTAGSNFMWDGYNGAAQFGTFYNFQTQSLDAPGTRGGCVSMHKRQQWMWAIESCWEYRTYICEYQAATSAPITTLQSEDASLGNWSSWAATASASNTSSTLPAEISATSVDDGSDKALALALSVGICVVLLVIAVVVLSVLLYRKQRQLKRPMSVGWQGRSSAPATTNASYAMTDQRSPSLERLQAIESPPYDGYVYVSDRPTAVTSTRTESAADDGHTYTEVLEPCMLSGRIYYHVTPSGNHQIGLAEGQAGTAQAETAPLIMYALGQPTNTHDSRNVVCTENDYVEPNPVTSQCTADNRPAHSSDDAPRTDVYWSITDFHLDDRLTDSYTV